ncbi:hypothetical protein D3C80_1160390 [compost metagenome]
MELLQQAQGEGVARVLVTHRLQRGHRPLVFAARHQQLGLGQGDRHRRLRLAQAGLLEHQIGGGMLAQLAGRTGGSQIGHQRLRAVLGSPAQQAQGMRPASGGEFEQPALGGQLHPPRAVAPRPGIDQPPRGAHQAEQQADAIEQRPQRDPEGEKHPQGRFVAKALPGDQHVAGMLGHRQAQQRSGKNRQQEQQEGAVHAPPSCAASPVAGSDSDSEDSDSGSTGAAAGLTAWPAASSSARARCAR